MKKSKSYRKQQALRRVSALFMTVIIGATGFGLTKLTHAATGYNHNAHGVVNYCTISGGLTTIHGWAHDPDAAVGAKPTVTVSVGTQTVTVNSDIANYHDAAINKYIAANWSGVPTASIYGWAASFSGLYQGNAYGVSVTANNVGTGESNVIREDTVSQIWDGISVQTLLNANNTVPDACLNARPVTPTPPPPVVTPPSNPSPGGSGSGGSGSNSSATTGSKPAAEVPTDATNTGQADASVSAGTLSAAVSVPADGAKTLYLLYGTSPDGLDNSSDDYVVSGDKAEAILSELQTKSTYYYQVIRTDSSDNITSSPNGTFKTAGYAITVHFADSSKKAVSGIVGILNDENSTQAKSDKNGDLKYFDLDGGSYTVKYQYKKLTYSLSFDTENISDDDSSSGKVVVLHNSVNISTLKNGSTAPLPSKKHGAFSKIVLVLLIVIIGGAIVWLIIRRRHLAAMNANFVSPYAVGNPGMIDLPTQAVPAPTPLPLPSEPHTPVQSASGEPLEHVGESLREMVIRSMHDEAQKRKADEHHDDSEPKT